MAASMLPAILAATIPSQSAAQATLAGSVTDTAGAPIFGARVTIAGSKAAAESDVKGHFRIVNAPTGTATVTVRRLGFVPFDVGVQIAEGSVAEVVVRMSPVAERLRPMVVRPTHVTYTGRLAGYYRRLEKRSSGVFISREDIDRANASTMGQLMARVPGIRATGNRGRITGLRLRGRTCWPLVWIDGTPMPAGEVDIDAFQPSSIQGIEIYLGATTAPLAYIGNRASSSCGTILIWSRGVDTDPIRHVPSVAEKLEALVARVAIYTADNVDRRAQLDSARPLDLDFPPPLYASRTGGLVVAEFVVDTLGRVEEGTVGIVSSTAPLFTHAVKVALSTAAFVPALKNGRPVRQLVQQPFEFDVRSEARQRKVSQGGARSPGL